jgi:predicted TIM-barrel fold metal-dependent hydrolase
VTVDGMRVLDADGHVVEAGGLFDRWVPPGEMPADLPATTPMVPCGSVDAVADQMEHGFDAPSYLRALDAQGIDGAVLYPSIGLYVPYLPQLSASESADVCRAYNDWVAEYCGEDPARLAAAALVPLVDPEAAAKEARRAADLGLVAAMVRPNHVYGRNLGDPAYDPLHEAVVEAGIVLAVHEGLGVRGATTMGSDRFSTFAARHAFSHPMEQMAAMTSLVLDGALERHPEMRVAHLESGTGWLAWWLHRLDEHDEWMEGSENAHLSLTPSEYFARQCVISSEADDARAAATIAEVGAHKVMWASDFPHPDAIFPGAAAEFIEMLDGAGTDRADTSRVLWDTPLAFYRLEDRFT